MFFEGMSQRPLTQLVVHSWTASITFYWNLKFWYVCLTSLSLNKQRAPCPQLLCVCSTLCTEEDKENRSPREWVLWCDNRLRDIMILESPLAAYFLPDFSHLPPLGQHQLNLNLRAETRLGWPLPPWRDTSQDTKCLWVKSGYKPCKPWDKCGSNILGKEATYLSKWIFVPMAALNSYLLCFRPRLKMPEWVF